nr:ras-related protein RABC1 [Parasteatoda tepidariorum]
MSDGVLLVYEVLDLKTFHSLTRLLSLIKKYNSVAVTFLVGAKSDCLDSVELSNETVEDFARKENLEQFQCSAKNGENVEKIFEHLVLRILQTKNLASGKKDEESPIILADDNVHLEGKSQTENPKSRNPKDNSQLILTQKESFIMVEIKSHASEEKKEGSFQIESNCRDPQKEVRTSLIYEEVSEGKCTEWNIDQK